MYKDYNNLCEEVEEELKGCWKKLVARTFRRSLLERYGVPTNDDTLSSLVEIVMSSAEEDASAVTLKSLANHHIANLLLLTEYSSTHYNNYMEVAWGKGYIFTVEQSIEDYLMALDEFGDFHLETSAHFIYYNQDIWHNDDFDCVMREL